MNADKADIRAALLAARDALSPSEREAKSRAVTERVLELPEFCAAGSLFVYADFRSEVQTGELMHRALEQGKRLVVSRTDTAARRLVLVEITDPESDLRPGYMGIPEPRDAGRVVEPGEIDLVLTPAVGLDPRGIRLGYGGGYYDRLFAAMGSAARRVALAFEVQVVPEIPAEPHDLPVHVVVTEERVLRPAAS